MAIEPDMLWFSCAMCMQWHSYSQFSQHKIDYFNSSCVCVRAIKLNDSANRYMHIVYSLLLIQSIQLHRIWIYHKNVIAEWKKNFDRFSFWCNSWSYLNLATHRILRVVEFHITDISVWYEWFAMRQGTFDWFDMESFRIDFDLHWTMKNATCIRCNRIASGVTFPRVKTDR